MAGQPARCGADGSPSVSVNHWRTIGWKGSRASSGITGKFARSVRASDPCGSNHQNRHGYYPPEVLI
jgi:hypothetical protein